MLQFCNLLFILHVTLISDNAARFRLFQVELGAKEATCNREVDTTEISTNHLPIHSYSNPYRILLYSSLL